MMYTNKEQSQGLLNLGFSPCSADMFYEYDYNEHCHNDVPRSDKVPCWDDEQCKGLPCWSSGRLIEIAPARIDGFGLTIDKTQNNRYRVWYTKKDSNEVLGGGFVWSDKPLIDGLCDLMEWLVKDKNMVV